MQTDAPKPAAPEPIREIETDRQFRTIHFAPGSALLFGAGYDGSICRWDLSGDEPKTLEPLAGHHGWAESLVFAKAKPQLFTTDSWGRLIAWKLGEAEPKIAWQHEQAHDGWIRAASLGGEESLVATAGRDKFVRVWSADDGKLLHELAGHDEEVFSVAVSPDGKTVASADLFGNLKLWRLPEEKVAQEKSLEKMHYYERDQDVAGVYSLAFDADGKQLIVAGSEPSNTGNVAGVPTLLWLNVDSLEVARTLQFGEAKQGYVHAYAIHDDGYVMVATSGAPGAGQFVCQRLDEAEPFFSTNKMSNCHGLAFRPDANQCVVAATNRNSQGNGAVRDKEGNYVGNSSPLHIFQLPDLQGA